MNMNIELSKILIRKVDTMDIDEMIRYRIDYLTEMQGERDENLVEKLKNELLAFFHKGIANNSFVALIAEHEDIIVGYGGLILREIPGDFNRASYLEGDILNMYTVPKARRKGISTIILNQLITVAKSLGVSKLALHTSKDGERLYRSVGFNKPLYPYLELILTD